MWDIWVFDELGIAGVAETRVRFVASGDDEVSYGMSALRQPWFSFSIVFPQTAPIVDAFLAGTRNRAGPCNTKRVRRTPEFQLQEPSLMVKSEGCFCIMVYMCLGVESLPLGMLPPFIEIVWRYCVGDFIVM